MGTQLISGFEMMTKNPMAVQTKLLMDLLQENKDTEYGKRYGFADITSIKEYQERVPITTYDDYEDYLYRMTHAGERKLICDADPVWYNKTSGTVGAHYQVAFVINAPVVGAELFSAPIGVISCTFAAILAPLALSCFMLRKRGITPSARGYLVGYIGWSVPLQTFPV